MRPALLFPLFADTTSLDGVGPKLAKSFERIAGRRVLDLIWLKPTGLVDRSFRPPIDQAPEGRICTFDIVVQRHQPAPRANAPYRILCANETGELTLVYFRSQGDWLSKSLPEGARRLISGEVQHYGGRVQITHPDRVLAPEDAAELDTPEPVYPLTAGLTLRPLQKAVRAALSRLPDLPEWQDAAWLRKQGWTDAATALRRLHAPESEADLDPGGPARQRLAYDELLANQLALALVRQRIRRQAGRPLVGDGAIRRRILDALPFALTGSQAKAIDEIDADLAGTTRMLRLLQGDVGSGKTLVALMALARAVEAGGQGVLMAPTEILARQHFEGLSPLVEKAGLRMALLTGRDKGKSREALLASLADGAIDILVGTHAVLEEDIAFKSLTLAVIDEQHRFGVHQRLAIGAKGDAVHLLVMTATPIPRSLTLSHYGDLDVSRLTEKPPGRQPIDTRALPLSRLQEVVDAVRRAITQGSRVYWVCPLVEESEAIDAAAAEDRAGSLRRQFGEARIGLVHGRLKGAEKDKVMADFQAGRIDVLVATTVIEVGVDVPDATIMVIEHAERFGLAQLHQLRGRVGRGTRRSACLLLYQTPLNEMARARIKVLRDSDDGFLIAEEDLRLRGAGELLGTRQSGLPDLHFADFGLHSDLLSAARDDARLVLEQDPDLSGPRGEALKTLLYLFERDGAIRNLRSG